ncbi:MAG: ATP-binding protein [Bacteroidetes bacterium]|nr:ATP-binding protein [Bacteroidota bacterium]
MKQLLILSGKGGTGKTTIAAAFSKLAGRSVVADCDVDAADLFILLKPEVKEKTEFHGGKKAVINQDLCSRCEFCLQSCRFDAIVDYSVDEVLCEGCGFCFRICPSNAIEFNKNLSGHLFDCRIPENREFLYAKLLPGEGNSGKLVTELKKKASAYCTQKEKEWLIIDGPPGIGCPVNASLSGVDAVLLVTEPTLSGLHDLKRIVRLVQSFKVYTAVVINKHDINKEVAEQIENYLHQENISLAGKISFDEKVVTALQQEKSILEYPENIAAQEILTIWNSLQTIRIKI